MRSNFKMLYNKLCEILFCDTEMPFKRAFKRIQKVGKQGTIQDYLDFLYFFCL